MNFDAGSENYEETSFDAILPAKELIKQIKTTNAQNKKLSLVVDIGCGPGNTAKMIARELNPERIVGIDIDSQMIEVAKQTNPIKDTEYYTQDISTPFSQWDENLQKLKGKVSVVFSNYALHWIKDVEQTAKNLEQLLSMDGVIVMDILFVGDIFRFLSAEQRGRYEKWLIYPNEQEVIGRWMSAFKNAGLRHCDVKYWEPKCVYPEKLYYDDFIRWPINWFKGFMKPNALPDVNVDEVLKELIIKDRVKKMNDKSAKGEDLIEITQQLWNFVVKRH